MNELQNLAKYRRYVLEKNNLFVVRGGIAPAIEGMAAYNTRYTIPPPEDRWLPAVQELMAAVALSAVSLADRESWGWSLTFKNISAGFFVGIEPEGMLCVRILNADAAMFSGMIQRQKAGLPMTQSHIKPRSSNPSEVVEQYFSEVVQTKTLLRIKKNGEGVLVQPLPGSSVDEFWGLDADDLIGFVDRAVEEESAKEAGEVLIFYECRCSEKMISRMVGNMDESDRQHLFAEKGQIQVECPRCGREYAVTKSDTSEISL